MLCRGIEIFESLFGELRTAYADFPDARRRPDPEVDYSMADIGLSVFSLLFDAKRVLFVLPTAVGEGTWDF
jgi:hypothetical protein